MINLTSIFVADGIGLALLLTTVFCNHTLLLNTKRKDMGYLRIILLGSMLACIVNPLVSVLDGKPGTAAHAVILIGNTYLFLVNLWLTYCWLAFLLIHVKGYSSKERDLLRKLTVIPAILAALTILNLLVPVVFSVEGNVYRRLPLAFMYWILMGGYLIYSVVIYLQISSSTSQIRFFPIAVFILPIVLGEAIQVFCYGISLVWAAIAVAMSGVLMCLRAEEGYIDQLTGVNNRVFLFSNKAHTKMNGAIMMDINNFKQINDTYGHSEGDEALAMVAGVVSSLISGKGFVVRYAGDEFIIFSQSGEEVDLKEICYDIRDGLAAISKERRKPYRLEASYGIGKYDHEKQSLDELIKEIDQNMYLAKNEYYTKYHDRRRR